MEIHEVPPISRGQRFGMMIYEDICLLLIIVNDDNDMYSVHHFPSRNKKTLYIRLSKPDSLHLCRISVKWITEMKTYRHFVYFDTYVTKDLSLNIISQIWFLFHSSVLVYRQPHTSHRFSFVVWTNFDLMHSIVRMKYIHITNYYCHPLFVMGINEHVFCFLNWRSYFWYTPIRYSVDWRVAGTVPWYVGWLFR